MDSDVTLVLGGARSGKSSCAAGLALNSGLPVSLLVTATACDDEMAARIARHQQDRPTDWTVTECPRDLPDALQREARPGRFVLVDCLTLWLNNLLYYEDSGPVAAHYDALQAALAAAPCPVVLVSNEVGLGVIPMGEVSRRFVDEAGRLNQRLAAQARRVVLVAAGLPLVLKG